MHSISFLQDYFIAKGVFPIKVTPMGGDKILLRNGGLHKNQSWLNQWISDVKPWEAGQTPLNHLIWLRL